MKSFLKVIGIVSGIIVIVLMIALFGAIIFLKNFDIKKYKPQIVQLATQATGRNVDFDDISLNISLKEGIRFHLKDLSIAEDADFGEKSFITVDEIDAGLNLIAFITSRQISIPSIYIHSPQINIVHNANGALNAETLGQTAASANQSNSAVASLPVIFINSFKIDNAKIHFIEKATQPEIQLTVDQVNLDVRRFSLTNPFDISIEGAVLSPQKNLQILSKVQINLIKQEAKISNMEANFDLAKLPLQELSTLPMLKGMPIPQEVEGQLKISFKEAIISSKGLEVFNAGVGLANGKLMAKEISPGISIEGSQLNMNFENFTLDSKTPAHLNFKGAFYQDQPNVDFDGMITFDLKTMGVQVTSGQFVSDLNRWPLEKIKGLIAQLKDVPLPNKLGGKIKVQIKDLTASPNGLGQMNMDAQWQEGNFALSEIAPGISLSANAINLDAKGLSLSKAFDITGSLGLETSEPNVTFNGKVAFDMATQNVYLTQMTVKTQLEKIPFEKLKTTIAPMKDVPLPEILQGKLDVNVKELSAEPQGLNSMAADILFTEGQVSMKEVAPGISFAASNIRADIKSFGLGMPFGFEVNLGYLNEQSNIHAKGSAIFQLEDQSLSLKETTADADLATFSLTSLQSSMASLKDVPLPESIRGKLNVSLSEAKVSPAGLLSVTAQGAIKDWEVKQKELLLPLKGKALNFKITTDAFTTDAIEATLGSGQITAKADVNDYMKSQLFNVSTDIKGISLAEILDQQKAPVKVEGLIFGSIKASGQGPDMNLMTGAGNFEVKNAKLRDLNVLKTILDKISFLPNVSSRVQAKLPEKYKDKLTNKDTEIKNITSPVVISKGAIILEPINVEADEFIFTGKCLAGFDQKYILDGAVKIPGELSTAMGEGIAELRYLFDENNNISMPVHVTGQGQQAPVVAMTQTALEVGKNAIRNQGKKELEGALFKVLGVKDTSTPSDPNTPQQTPSAQPSPESQIFDSIFNKVFK